MLETLADHDDELMEQLLEDIQPPRDKVFDDLAKELREGLVCPVLIGSARRMNGALRLMKALRHEAPTVAATAKRLGVKSGNEAVAYVLKTFHTSMAASCRSRACWQGQLGDGTTLNSPRRSRPRRRRVQDARAPRKRSAAGRRGETVALGKLDNAKTGDTLSSGKQPHRGAGRGQAAAAGSRHCDLGEGTQGRRQARPGA